MITRPFSIHRVSNCRPISSGSAPGRATRITTMARSSSTVQRERVLGTVSRSALKAPSSSLSQTLNSGERELPLTSRKPRAGTVRLFAGLVTRDAALAVEGQDDTGAHRAIEHGFFRWFARDIVHGSETL